MVTMKYEPVPGSGYAQIQRRQNKLDTQRKELLLLGARMPLEAKQTALGSEVTRHSKVGPKENER
jgi:hypothetical protein